MAGGSGGRDGEVGFQIAPMIDLILVLMVFFMTTVALKQKEQEIGIMLPGGHGPAESIPLTIDIHGDGSVNMNEETVGAATDRDLAGLQTKLREQIRYFSDRIPVIIQPQSDVPHSRVIAVLNACTASGVKNISFGG